MHSRSSFEEAPQRKLPNELPKSFWLAKSIIQTLVDHGYTGYFAGGWVRDYLLGNLSHEVDIATSAPPEKIQALFSKTIPVGIAFGVVIVLIEGIAFEVSTFRKDRLYVDGRHPEGVDYSTPEKDALRRDFTINGMFYDPLTDRVIDYVEGQKDLKAKIIRAIGNPTDRIEEDRLRMIRAVRFASRFQFTIEKQTESAIISHSASLFPSVSMERITQELTKMTATARFDEAILLLHRLGLLTTLFPKLLGLSLDTLALRLKPFPYFPPNTPLMFYLLELFPDATLPEKIELCRTFKISNEEIKLVEFFHESLPLFLEKKTNLTTFAHFYADLRSPLILSVMAAKLPADLRPAFYQFHEEQQAKLSFHIQHLRDKKPLVTAADLQKEGIAPGPQMGQLLKRAEWLSIEEDLREKEQIIAKLKASTLWPSL